MNHLVKQAQLQFKALAATEQPAKEQVRAALAQAVELAQRAEAGRAITGGFFGGGLISAIDQVITIATPLVAIYGDFELSNLLGSLKVWLNKKQAQEERERREAEANTINSWEDLNFTYTF